mgnify:CR=1 FL=1
MGFRFVDKNGNFKPTSEPAEGKMSVRYLREIQEYTYYHPNIEESVKLDALLVFEKEEKELLERILKPMSFEYEPKWSPKLKR